MPSYAEYDVRTLALALDANRQTQRDLREAAVMIEAELYARIQANGGSALLDDDFKIEVKHGSPSYDTNLLTPLKEELPADDLAKAYSPETTKVVVVAERWDGRQLNALERRYGGAIARRIQEARVPGNASLVVERKVPTATP